MAPESRHLKAVRTVLRGFAERGVSLEVLLGGKKPGGVLEPQFTDDFLRRNLSRGRENRITGMGLNRGLLD